MAKKDCIPYGSDVSAGTFECVDCGYEMPIKNTPSLPPCTQPNCSHLKNCWKCLTGQGDATEDPYPDA